MYKFKKCINYLQIELSIKGTMTLVGQEADLHQNAPSECVLNFTT